MVQPSIDALKLHFDFVKILLISQLHANLVHSNLHSDATTITKFDLPFRPQMSHPVNPQYLRPYSPDFLHFHFNFDLKYLDHSPIYSENSIVTVCSFDS